MLNFDGEYLHNRKGWTHVGAGVNKIGYISVPFADLILNPAQGVAGGSWRCNVSYTLSTICVRFRRVNLYLVPQTKLKDEITSFSTNGL